MITYDRGDVVLVPFPFSDQTTTKKRPAVVVSTSLFNKQSPDLVILAVTSKINSPIGIGECLIGDWKAAGLMKPSAIKAAISTMEHTLVLRKLGALSQADVVAMNLSLSAFLGI
jgi:mRNA interferase MazF